MKRKKKRRFCAGPHTWRAIRRLKENWWVCAQRNRGAEFRNDPPLWGEPGTQGVLDQRWAMMEEWVDLADMINESKGEEDGRENQTHN